MKCFAGRAVALTFLIALPAVAAHAQSRGVSPMHYNNPFNQFGMYNNAPGMYYNNPFNQFGMYNKSASMKYNNPHSQSGMYNNTPTMKYSSGFNQSGMYNNAAGTSSSSSAAPAGLTGWVGSSYGSNSTLSGQSLFSGSVGVVSSSSIGLERFANGLLTSTGETVPVLPSPPGRRCRAAADEGHESAR